MSYVQYVEKLEKGMLRHCGYCEKLTDPVVKAKIIVLRKIFNTDIITTGVCPECEEIELAKIDARSKNS